MWSLAARRPLAPGHRLTSLCTSAARTQHRLKSIDSRYVNISEEVKQAVNEKRPVVALESTIYTHGFPYPQNMVLATNLESIVRSAGAVPATIGILDGVARIGLDGDDLIRLASSSQDPDNLLKVSRRDLSFALSAKTSDGRAYTGGTTVAGTMVLAHLAGVRIFATGGLGGVHRGVSETLDISADLTELGRTPLAVIAAGCKAFLDIPKTLEYLETQGVAVATLSDGRAGNVDFPGFWSRDSGFPSPMTVPDELTAAEMIVAQSSLGLQSGMLFGSPVPAEYEIPIQEIQLAIDQALREASAQGITGNKATPFILAKIKELTGSQSVATNTALVENNVRVGAKMAMEVSFLERYQNSRRNTPDTKPQATSTPMPTPNPPSSQPLQSRGGPSPAEGTSSVHLPLHKPKVFVAGMLAVDFACDYRQRQNSTRQALELRTSNPARITHSLGGVGHNVAQAIALSGVETRLLSAVGSDINGAAAMTALQSEDMDITGIATLPRSSGRQTAQYVAINDHNKDLVVAMADMNILEYDPVAAKHIDDAFATRWLPNLQKSTPTHLVVDANWSSEYLTKWLAIARQLSAKVMFEPVSTAKAAGLFPQPVLGQASASSLTTYPEPSVHIATPNEHELSSMYDAAKERGYFERPEWWQIVDAFGIPSTGARAKMALATSSELVDRGIPQKTLQLLPYMPCITTKLGANGVLVTQIISANDPRLSSPEHAPHMLSYCTNGSEKDTEVGGVYMRLFPAAEVVDAADNVSVNGVGDTFAGVLVAGLAKKALAGQPERVEDLIDIAQRASVLTLKSPEAVNPELRSLSSLI